MIILWEESQWFSGRNFSILSQENTDKEKSLPTTGYQEFVGQDSRYVMENSHGILWKLELGLSYRCEIRLTDAQKWTS